MRKQDELTKQGCLNKAADDEMLFVLRAQDITAPKVILNWIEQNFHTCSEEKLREAFECAIEMKKFKRTKVAD